MTHVQGDWLTAPATQEVMALLENHGHQALAVGGCVRNALLGVPVTDVDISTDARPDRVMALAEKAGIKAVPTGIDHGTVTLVHGGTPFEITTFRADVETDGRRAVVRFADTVDEDARRRDFTMNALYADRRGAVLDPLGGLPDLHARRFRFIEDAETRIREDYLRTLRFFRFSAWYGDPAEGMDAEALSAIAVTLDGLSTLSRERVGSEVLKLLAAPDPVMAVSVMAQTGVLAQILPGASPRALGPLMLAEQALELHADPIRRLAATGFREGAALRLSKTDSRALEVLADLTEATTALPEIAYRDGQDTALSTATLRSAMLEMPVDSSIRAQITAAAAARFPVRPADLMPDLQGPALGDALKTLEARWIASGFALGRDALLDSLKG
jgi:poly(A) polymerase